MAGSGHNDRPHGFGKIKPGNGWWHQTCTFSWDCLEARAITTDPDWRKLLAEYEAAVEAFARVSRTLTAALMDGKASNDDVQALLAVESRHKEVVSLMRMRLLNLWRAAQTDLGTLPQLNEDGEQEGDDGGTS
jgi:hypothetical protein